MDMCHCTTLGLLVSLSAMFVASIYYGTVNNVMAFKPECQTIEQVYINTTCAFGTDDETIFILMENMKLIEIKTDQIYNFNNSYIAGESCWISRLEYDLYFIQNRTKQIEIRWSVPASFYNQIIDCNVYDGKMYYLYGTARIVLIFAGVFLGLMLYVFVGGNAVHE